MWPFESNVDVLDRGIPRDAIQDSQLDYEDVKGELFKECRATLGYNASDAIRPQKQLAYLLSVLHKSGIDPLNEKRVESYKFWQEVRVDKILWRALLMLAIVSTVQIIIHTCLGKWPWQSADKFDWFLPLFIGAISIFVGGGASFGPGEYSEWKRISLEGYTRPVPEFALSYALTIKRMEPKIKFEILELVKKARVADPFLVATYGDAKAYIAVWDEPTFEGRKAKIRAQ